MINSIGLPNKGLEGFLEQDLPELASFRAADRERCRLPHDEFATLVEKSPSGAKSRRSS